MAPPSTISTCNSSPAAATASYSLAPQHGEHGRWKGRAPDGALELERVRSVWWRRPHTAESTRLFTGVDHSQFVQTEADHFLQGLLWSRRCLWVNDPMNSLRASRTIVQLSRARDAGLPTPATLITNDPAEARGFVEALPGRAVLKRNSAGANPSTGAATKTIFITPDILRRLDTIVDCPTMFQAYVEAEARSARRLDRRRSLDGVDRRAVWSAGR